MRNILKRLGKDMYTPGETVEISRQEINDFLDNCIVGLPAGGFGERLKGVTGTGNTHKTSLVLPNGETMIERTIRMYAEVGLKRFVAFIFHHASSIIDILGDGGELGVSITYCEDPGKAIGRGGAILNALIKGSIPGDRNLIVHNPDDQILDYRGRFPIDIVRGHLSGRKKNAIATPVVVLSQPYGFTGMKIVNGKVEEIRMYPHIPIPTHIGVTVFSPEVYPYFHKLFDLEEKKDFEGSLFPLLAREGKLWSVKIPRECWLPVNDPKALGRLIEALDKE